jgi:Domain of unknown function (DU1801)
MPDRTFDQLVKGYSPGVQSLAREARDLILDLMGADAQESIDRSGPYAFYSYAAPRLGGPRSGQAGYKGLVCSLILSKTGVKLGLSHGATLDDPHKLLQGAGKVHKHIALKTPADLTKPGLRALVKSAIKAWQARSRGQAPPPARN